MVTEAWMARILPLWQRCCRKATSAWQKHCDNISKWQSHRLARSQMGMQQHEVRHFFTSLIPHTFTAALSPWPLVGQKHEGLFSHAKPCDSMILPCTPYLCNPCDKGLQDNNSGITSLVWDNKQSYVNKPESPPLLPCLCTVEADHPVIKYTLKSTCFWWHPANSMHVNFFKWLIYF